MQLSRLCAAGLVLVIISTLSGCQQIGTMDIRGSLDSPEIRARGAGLLGPRAVCVRSFGIFGMWDVRSETGDCVRVSYIKYGEVPVGFVEREAAKPLVAGVIYDVAATGSTGSIPNVGFSAHAAFVFDQGRWRHVEVQ